MTRALASLFQNDIETNDIGKARGGPEPLSPERSDRHLGVPRQGQTLLKLTTSTRRHRSRTGEDPGAFCF